MLYYNTLNVCMYLSCFTFLNNAVPVFSTVPIAGVGFMSEAIGDSFVVDELLLICGCCEVILLLAVLLFNTDCCCCCC